MIKENFLNIKERISLICAKIRKDSGDVIFVSVSKNRSVAQIKEALESGITDIGENRVQEAAVKYAALRATSYPGGNLRWHMVGHLQTNKVKEAVGIFDLIHSVDSLRLAEEINKQAARINKVQDILIEVKTSLEATKYGVMPQDTPALIKDAAGFKNLNIKGLMTIAPLLDNAQKARPHFKTLKELFDYINKLSAIDRRLSILSMGMTDDFEVAIEEGANMLRIGRALFEG
jgi:pyridoxal phosphate enzyme (YggS family)